MSTTLKTRAALDVASIPVTVKLAAAWASFMFVYVYVDVFNFYKPHVVAGILDGMIWRFEVSPPLLTGMLASVMIPAVMIVLSVVLPPRANRTVNVVVASLYVPYSVFNIAGSTAEWLPFYVLSIGVELALLGFIVRRAWTSDPRREAGALGAER
ncbi:hypothetical protein JVX92_09025 [Microbacterium hominis]|uniref:DUF6326 family protein n=1 Tax=Microbacterium hominis TaxID=162426 RepID=UPI00196609EC|nr:DUF6326 family protein [Microbacterium hominis]QRY39685.1 hypothetical protein JVX92_09025 [Microbacterium hominis]